MDDSDSWVCRPHHPGEIREALVGRKLTAANRRGKSMACETSGVGRSRSPGPELGIHLGMSGRILIMAAGRRQHRGRRLPGRALPRAADAPNRKPIWDRFTITFADGGSLRLVRQASARAGAAGSGPRTTRTGRGDDHRQGVRGPDRPQRGSGQGAAARPERHRRRRQPARGRDAVAGPDLAAPARASRSPPTSCRRSAEPCARRPRRRSSTGGVHTGTIIEYRKTGRHCPRCGAEMTRATVGGRTTWWCPQEQTATEQLFTASRMNTRPRSASSTSSTARRVRASIASCSNHASTADASTSAVHVLPQAGPHPGQALLGRVVLTVDELRGEPCQHDGVAAQHRVPPEVGRAAVEQIRRRRRLPVRRSRRPYPMRASRAARRSRTPFAHLRTPVRLCRRR